MEKFYTQTTRQTLKELATSESGLDNIEAKNRLKAYGPNTIQRRQDHSLFVFFLRQFESPLVYILLIAAIISYFLGHGLDTIVILAVTFINACFGALHEIKAEKALDALAKIIELKTRIKRSGKFEELSSWEVVPGDIVHIEAGMKSPADMRILESFDIRVDESALTGESNLVAKKDVVLPEGTDLADRINMLYAGTMVSSGRGIGIVAETGRRTEFGKIAKEVADLRDEETSLQKRMNGFSKQLLVLIVIACLVILAIGLINGMDKIDLLMVVIAVAIATIPEGLPAVITVTLAYGAHKMARQKAVVRKLGAIETLGSITVIASDKTGTLTHNQQTIQKIYLPGKVVDVTGSGYEPAGDFLVDGQKIQPIKDSHLARFLTVGALCNDAEVYQEDDEWAVQGDPTEGALICLAEKAHLDKEVIDEKMSRLDEIPFETKNAYMATLHKSKGQNIIAVKGAIEKVLSFSTHLLKNGKKIKLDGSAKKEIVQRHEEFACDALRIIAVAYKEIDTKTKTLNKSDLKELTFVGFAGMIDPPREEAIEAVQKCLVSGIRPIMITGDYPITAKAVARDVGIIRDDLEKVVVGHEIENISDSDLSRIVKHHSVYARITPEMKLRIVKTLQKQGNAVAVTGDGINDAPALKQADIGVAMGRSGTDVSREVADLVLMDNNFATIVTAIEEGRTIFQNIRRSVFYFLSTNASELIVVAAGLFLGWPLILLPIQILWINLVSDGTSGIALALEPSHSGLMKYKPRSLKEPILSRIIIGRIMWVSLVTAALTLAVYYREYFQESSIVKAQTMAFAVIVVIQILNMFNSRSMRESIVRTPLFSNPYIIGSVVLSLMFSLAAVEIGYMQRLFGTVALDFSEWITVFGLGLAVIAIVEIEKLLRRQFGSKY